MTTPSPADPGKADHIFTVINRLLYERYNIASAFAGPLAEGPVDLPLQFMAQLRCQDRFLGQALLRSQPYFLQERRRSLPPRTDARACLALLAQDLALAVLREAYAAEAGAVALVTEVDGEERWSLAVPSVAFVMMVGAAPLEVRLWST